MPVCTYLGCPLNFEIPSPSRGGIPVLFIQGVGVHGGGWKPQIDFLGQHFSCLSFDNRGIGGSVPIGDAPITVEQMAADALAIMDAAGWTSAHIVGHSLGGLIAQHIALAEPARVRSLSLLCTVSRGRDAVRLTSRMLWIGARTRIGTRRSRRRAFLQIVMPASALRGADREALAENLASLFGHDLAVQPAIVNSQLAALKAYDATHRLGELSRFPTLVVSAEHDPIAPPQFGRALANAIPGARYVEIPDASHGVPIQLPERINTLLSDHIRRADAGAT